MKPKKLSDAEQMWTLLSESKVKTVEETTHRDDKKDALGPGEYVCPKTGNIMSKDGKVVHKNEKHDVKEEMNNMEFSAIGRENPEQMVFNAILSWMRADTEGLTTPEDMEGYNMSTAFDDAKDFIKQALQDISFSEVKAHLNSTVDMGAGYDNHEGVAEAKKHEDQDHEDKDKKKGKYDDGDGKEERCDFVPCDEEAKPDYPDIDNDGDKEESMKKAAKDKKHGKKHDCAKKVQHEKYGLGECIPEAHGEPVNGHVNWYTVVFEHGTEVVDTEDLVILVSESHEH